MAAVRTRSVCFRARADLRVPMLNVVFLVLLVLDWGLGLELGLVGVVDMVEIVQGDYGWWTG